MRDRHGCTAESSHTVKLSCAGVSCSLSQRPFFPAVLICGSVHGTPGCSLANAAQKCMTHTHTSVHSFFFSPSLLRSIHKSLSRGERRGTDRATTATQRGKFEKRKPRTFPIDTQLPSKHFLCQGHTIKIGKATLERSPQPGPLGFASARRRSSRCNKGGRAAGLERNRNRGARCRGGPCENDGAAQKEARE